MARLIALNALFFLIPFAAYAAWLLVTKRRVNDPQDWRNRVIIWLCAIGVVFVLIGLVLLVSFSGTTTNETYHPAELQDGQIIPGRFGDE